jgi:hypothetical protein
MASLSTDTQPSVQSTPRVFLSGLSVPWIPMLPPMPAPSSSSPPRLACSKR